MNTVKFLKCKAYYDSDVRAQKLRHEHGFCLSSPGRGGDNYSMQKRKDGARRGWEKRRKQALDSSQEHGETFFHRRQGTTNQTYCAPASPATYGCACITGRTIAEADQLWSLIHKLRIPTIPSFYIPQTVSI
jgi:hypothetical protein